jgi:hypothetical protein
MDTLSHCMVRQGLMAAATDCHLSECCRLTPLTLPGDTLLSTIFLTGSYTLLKMALANATAVRLPKTPAGWLVSRWQDTHEFDRTVSQLATNNIVHDLLLHCLSLVIHHCPGHRSWVAPQT